MVKVVKRMAHIPEDKLMQYVDNELPEAEAQEVKEHLESCPECRDRHTQLANFNESVTQTGRFVFKKGSMTQDENATYVVSLRKKMLALKLRIAGYILLFIGILVALWTYQFPAVFYASVALAGIGVILLLVQMSIKVRPGHK